MLYPPEEEAFCAADSECWQCGTAGGAEGTGSLPEFANLALVLTSGTEAASPVCNGSFSQHLWSTGVGRE